MLRLVVITALMLTTQTAMAGYCDEDNAADQIKRLEAYAKGKGEAPELNHLCMETAQSVPKLVKRVIAACTTLIAREPKHGDCIEWSVKYGATQLGGVELFGRVGEAFRNDPFSYGAGTMELYGKLADPRALPLITATWTAALADKRATQAKHTHNWTVWRHAAIGMFAKLGGATERAFLDEQAKAVKDRGLRKAIAKAIAAIDKRKP
jgi:hypothetical protein